MNSFVMRKLLQNKKIQTALAVCFWLLAWQAASALVGSALLLVSPLAVLGTLGTLVFSAGFWQVVAFSAVRILAGFVLALAAGALLAVCAARFGFVRVLLQPLMLTVKSVPVASFIILALLWLRGAGLLAVFISFLMVLPVVYANTLTGIAAADTQLLEMAHVFRVPVWRRVRYLYLPALVPQLRAACSVGLGLCWKSGVAAEVIGIVTGSIGEALYNAKIFLATAELFAWTLVIVLVSVVFERLFLALYDAVMQRLMLCGLRGAHKAPARVDPADIRSKATQNDFVLRGVTKTFGAQTVLHGVDAGFAAGEAVCVMAPSGVGKTTLLRVLLGLETPEDGSVTGTANVRFACAFQEDRLAPQLSAMQNVRLACGAVPDAVLEEAFAALGLAEADIAKPAAQLSGGQQRRVALARALLAGADAVMLDEPFQGLDAQTRAAAAQFVRTWQHGRTVLVVTHDVQDAAALGARVWRLPQ